MKMKRSESVSIPAYFPCSAKGSSLFFNASYLSQIHYSYPEQLNCIGGTKEWMWRWLNDRINLETHSGVFLNIVLYQYEISTCLSRHLTPVESLQLGRLENF